MTRKRFFKKMMVMGFSRNALRYITKELIEERERRRYRGHECWVNYSRIYEGMMSAWMKGGVNVALCNENWEKKLFGGGSGK